MEIGNPDGGGVHLTFDDFVLEESDGCKLDFVQVARFGIGVKKNKQTSIFHYPPIPIAIKVLDENKKAISAKMCGSQIPGPITSPGNMTVVFHRWRSQNFFLCWKKIIMILNISWIYP